MDSEFQKHQYQHHFQGPQKQFHHQKQQLNSLTRFCSAPSSYFASFLDAADTITNTGGAGGGDGGSLSNVHGDFSNSRPLSPETEDIFARFMASMGDAHCSSQNLPRTSPMQPESGVRVKQENDTLYQQQQKSPRMQGSYYTTPQMIYPSASKPPLASQHSSGSAMGSVRVNSSTPHMKIGIGGSSGFNLTRQSSSPAEFFSDLNIEGYDVMGRIGNYADSITSKNQINHSLGQPSSTSELITQHTDGQGTLRRMNSLDETIFSNSHNIDNNFTTGPVTSWDRSILSENVGVDDKRRIFSEQNSSNNQTGENRSHPPPLAHQLSLPNTSAELSAMEKLLNLQDAVPLRIRAKRGFATHPRSIAERVRKNKISERMRKLQNLVPNMDKQTNTADMLDLAVDYIKDLQKQVKNMNGIRAKCTCLR